MKTNPNDFAFSDKATEISFKSKHIDGGILSAHCPPLTKREYFSAIALQGLLASPDILSKADVHAHAEYAVECSDALISALNAEILIEKPKPKTDRELLEAILKAHHNGSIFNVDQAIKEAHEALKGRDGMC